MAGGGSSASDFTLFNITMELTEEGLNHIEDIISIIYQYIKLMKGGVSEWIFDEVIFVFNEEVS